MRRAALSLALFVLALLALTSGCSSPLERDYPDKQRFVIKASRERAPGEGRHGLLRVERLRVASLFERTGFVYRKSETVFEDVQCWIQEREEAPETA